MTTNYAQAAIRLVDSEKPGLAPELVGLYALLVLVTGTKTTRRNVHDAWAVWTALARGEHPSLIPFEELGPEIQELDQPYVDAIRRAAAGLEES